LCERGEDLPLLIEYFVRQHAARRGTPAKIFAPEAMNALLQYRWPGNVRELENTIEYALTVSLENEVGIRDLPPAITSRNPPPNTNGVLQQWLSEDLSLSELERRYILLMLERYDGHQINAAAALGIDRRTLSRKLQQYGSRILKKEEFKIQSRSFF